MARCTVELVLCRNNITELPDRPRYRRVPNQPTAGALMERRFRRDEHAEPVFRREDGMGVMPQPSEIKQDDRAKHRAHHHSLRETR